MSAAARMASSPAFCAATAFSCRSRSRADTLASACFSSAARFTRTASSALRSTDVVDSTLAGSTASTLEGDRDSMSDDAILSSVVHTAMARSAPSDRSAPFVTAS